MATLYFNAAVDYDWNTLGNWWEDDTCTTPASSLPSATDAAYILWHVSVNSGGPISIYGLAVDGCDFAVTATVSHGATFTSGAIAATLSGTIIGSALFQNGGYNYGTVIGDAVFDNSHNHGSVTGSATFENSATNNFPLGSGPNVFNDYSTNYNADGSGAWDATFNDYSMNQGIVPGNSTYNDAAVLYENGNANYAYFFHYSTGLGWIYYGAEFREFSACGQTGSPALNSAYLDATCDATFADDSTLYDYVGIAGTVTFLNRSRNRATLAGASSVVFDYDKGVNGSSILGIA